MTLIQTDFKLRPIQVEKANELASIVRNKRIALLSGQVRSGKTLTVLATADVLNKKNVLFLTKKNAISSIKSDFKLSGYKYNLTVINYESIHKVESGPFDLIVCDESHSLGSFPKPSNRAKAVREVSFKSKCDMILVSGTPSPESYSQLYHQFWTSFFTPFIEPNFYKWANVYVDKYTIKINGMDCTKYDKAIESKVKQLIGPLTVTMTQAEAGFKSKVNEIIDYVEMNEIIYKIANKLRKDLIVEGKEEVILADTPVKLMQKLHQIYSGTVKFESGNTCVLDTSKVDYIARKWANKKIAIFYKFKAELDMIKSVLGDSITDKLETFQTTDKSIALQFQSGREGVNLSKASDLIFLNIDFSAVSYFQARDRLTTKERAENTVHWIFAKGGIESMIYKAVSKKKDFTVNYFKKNCIQIC